ncbi:MAG: hypothetical protein AAB354_04170 [candidate division KSB1 bacterium]
MPRFLKPIFFLFTLLLLAACGGSQKLVDQKTLEPWVGTWRGQGVRDNRIDPLQQWTLTLALKGNQLAGKMSDELGEMRNVELRDVRVAEGELHFKLSYESSRGLHVLYRHRARMQGDKLLSLFEGNEGGKSFAGKWEAKRVYEDNAVKK